MVFVFLFFLVVVIIFETRSHYVALTGLELAMKPKLALNSEIHSLHLSSAGIKGRCHHAQFILLFCETASPIEPQSCHLG